MSSEQLGSLVPLVLIVAAAYFLLIRPARKRAQDVNALQRALAVGSEVMLTSGIFGTVVSINDDRVEVDVAEGVILTVHRGAIGKVVSPAPFDEDEVDYEGLLDDDDETPLDEHESTPDDRESPRDQAS